MYYVMTEIENELIAKTYTLEIAEQIAALFPGSIIRWSYR